MTFRWAVIDLETTGLHINHDQIIEIAVMILTEIGIERTWHTLINPGLQISNEITQLTGINNDMLKTASVFGSIAAHLEEMLRDCVVIAHNARFDCGFLKRAFKSAGIRFQPKLLCTIKLARVLYPEMGQYSLSHISNYFNFPAQQHRAFNDVELLHLFLKRCIHDFSIGTLLSTIKKITTKASTPSKLSTDISTLSSGAGVYLFYGESNAIPIYIGKSVNLRQRIMSHFQADHSHAKEFKLAQQVHSIETIETAGELSALLLESQLIKEKMPLFNRRLRRKKTIIGFIVNQENTYTSIQLSTQSTDEASVNLLGAFPSVHAAKKILHELVNDYQLCPKLCGLEKSAQACFSYQLHRCKGACINKETSEHYNLRVENAMAKFTEEAWPYPAAIAIKEQSADSLKTQWLIFNHWRHLATVECLSQINQSGIETTIKADKDAYLILRSYLNKTGASHQLVLLNDIV